MTAFHSQVLAAFGADLRSYGTAALRKDFAAGARLLCLDGSALETAHQQELPCLLIDDCIGTDGLIRGRKRAQELAAGWFEPERERFTSDEICWPELDADALFWFWRDTALTLELAGAFASNGGRRLFFFRHKRPHPRLHYCRSDTQAVILEHRLGDRAQALIFAPHETAGRFVHHAPAITFTRTDGHGPDVLAGKLVVAINPAEYHRFKGLLQDLDLAFPGKVAIVLISHYPSGPSTIGRESGLPVVCPLPDKRPDVAAGQRFQEGFHALVKGGSVPLLTELAGPLDFHFDYHCAVRWPVLQASGRAWRRLWQRWRPAAVIVSSLSDAESQLPAVAANAEGIVTLALPHGAMGPAKIRGQSRHVLYDNLLQAAFYRQKGVPADRLEPCRGITAVNEYPSRRIPAFDDPRRWRILVLLDPVFVDGCISPFIAPGAQIEALKVLAHPPRELAEQIDLRIKVHPGFPNRELAAVAGAPMEKLLPSDAELKTALVKADLVLAVNYAGSALLEVARQEKPLMFFWTDRLNLAAPDFDIAAVLESVRPVGEFVEDADTLWAAVRAFFSDQRVKDALVERMRSFRRRFLENGDYPDIGTVASRAIAGSGRMEPAQRGEQERGGDGPGSVATVEIIDADPDFYYGEIGREDFMEILSRGNRTGDVEAVVAEYCLKTGNDYFRRYALDPRRALAIKLFETLADKRLLDYGCGIGSIGLVAARAGARVTFVDSCLPRLEVARLRAGQHGIVNARFTACRHWRSLPAGLGPFDIIVLNGVLEWIPQTCNSRFEDVLDTQIDFLTAMGRLLAPGGKILLAIENRFALQYFMGYPEDHTDIAFLSLMDRCEANRLHLDRKGAPYLAQTWSLADFDRYLPRAGLRVEQGFGIFPDYRFPQTIVSLEDRAGLKRAMALETIPDPHRIRGRFIDYVYQMGLIEHFIYCFCMVIGKDG